MAREISQNHLVLATQLLRQWNELACILKATMDQQEDRQGRRLAFRKAVEDDRCRMQGSGGALGHGLNQSILGKSSC